MLVYEKRIENEDGELERHLFGTMANIPSDDDNQLVYQDPDGGELTPVLGDIYLDGGSHNIIRKSDEVQVDVYIQPLDGGDLVNIIPGYPSEEPVELVGITVATMPSKVEYQLNENLDLTGVVIEATYSDKSTEDVTVDCTFEPADGTQLTEVGEKSIAVSYEDKTASLIVTVLEVEPVLESIEVTTQPTKTEYFVNDMLDVEGLVITATYDDGSTIDVTGDCAFNPEVFEEAGEISVEVSYEDKTCEFNVTVTELEVTGITVTTMPTKVEYQINENLDLTGVVIEATYSDGTTSFVTDGCEFEPDDGTVLDSYGEQSIAVSYEGAEASFIVTVVGPELTGIEVTTMPTKVNYFVGEELDVDGAVITATYFDETTQDVTEDCVFAPTVLETAGEIEIIVSYEDKECSFNVTVETQTEVEDETELVNAIENGENVKLNDDITVSDILAMSKSVDIDLNGHTLQGADAKRMLNVKTDSGEGVVCKIHNGVLDAQNNASSPAVFVGGNCGLELSEVTLNTTGNESIMTNGKQSNVTIKCESCEINGEMYFPAGGEYYFKDCTVNSKLCNIYTKAGVWTIDGGEFNVTGGDGNWYHWNNGCKETGDNIIIEACNYPSGNATVTILGNPTFTHDAPSSEEYNTYDVLAIDWRNSEEDTFPTSIISSSVGYRHAEVTGYASTSGPYYHFTDENTEFVEV